MSVSSKQLNLAIVGAGLIGQRHAAVIQSLDDTALVGIVDMAADGIAFANSLNVPVYSTINELIDKATPDGIIICTPTSLHVEQGLESIAAGIPALIEKPIGVSATDSRRLVNEVEQSNVPVIVGHHRRHNPLIHAAKRSIDAGDIGDIRAIHSHCWFYKPDHYFEVAPWRTQPGAGPISVNLVHDVDLIRYLCGDVIEVQAQRAASARGYDNEDVATALLKLANGALATITVSDSVVSPWSWEFTSGEYPIYPETSQSCYQIGGSKGSLSVPDLSVWTHEEKPDWWSPMHSKRLAFEPLDPLVKQMEHFCRVIQGTEAPLVTAEEGYRSLRVIEAIQEASLSGERILLDER